MDKTGQRLARMTPRQCLDLTDPHHHNPHHGFTWMRAQNKFHWDATPSLFVHPTVDCHACPLMKDPSTWNALLTLAAASLWTSKRKLPSTWTQQRSCRHHIRQQDCCKWNFCQYVTSICALNFCCQTSSWFYCRQIC